MLIFKVKFRYPILWFFVITKTYPVHRANHKRNLSETETSMKTNTFLHIASWHPSSPRHQQNTAKGLDAPTLPTPNCKLLPSVAQTEKPSTPP